MTDRKAVAVKKKKMAEVQTVAPVAHRKHTRAHDYDFVCVRTRASVTRNRKVIKFRLE